jgi:hypothetical protein
VTDQTTRTDWETRARTAEARVEELAAERARLWDEVQRLRAQERQVEYYEAQHRYMQNTASWRVTWPLRALKTAYIKVRNILEG